MSETGGDGDDTFVPFAVRTRPPLQLSVREEVVAEKALQQHASNAGKQVKPSKTQYQTKVHSCSVIIRSKWLKKPAQS